MAYFPMFINLENKKVIVLGGGKTALRKINSLIKFDCKIAVIAPRICDEIKAVQGISVHESNMTLDALDTADMVIAATKRDDVNAKIGKYCNEHNIPVNVADNKDVSSFLFPGIVMREDLLLLHAALLRIRHELLLKVLLHRIRPYSHPMDDYENWKQVQIQFQDLLPDHQAAYHRLY